MQVFCVTGCLSSARAGADAATAATTIAAPKCFNMAGPPTGVPKISYLCNAIHIPGPVKRPCLRERRSPVMQPQPSISRFGGRLSQSVRRLEISSGVFVSGDRIGFEGRSTRCATAHPGSGGRTIGAERGRGHVRCVGNDGPARHREQPRPPDRARRPCASGDGPRTALCARPGTGQPSRRQDRGLRPCARPHRAGRYDLHRQRHDDLPSRQPPAGRPQSHGRLLRHERRRHPGPDADGPLDPDRRILPERHGVVCRSARSGHAEGHSSQQGFRVGRWRPFEARRQLHPIFPRSA